MIYLSVVPALLISALCYEKSRARYHNTTLLLYLLSAFVFLPLLLISGLRGAEVGLDTQRYLELFRHIREQSFSELLVLNSHGTARKEIGYEFFCKFLSLLNKSGQISLFAMALLFLLCFWHMINSLSVHRRVLWLGALYFLAQYCEADGRCSLHCLHVFYAAEKKALGSDTLLSQCFPVSSLIHDRSCNHPSLLFLACAALDFRSCKRHGPGLSLRFSDTSKILLHHPETICPIFALHGGTAFRSRHGTMGIGVSAGALSAQLYS